MRRLTDESRVRRLMARLGAIDAGETRIYFTGGVTAVLLGWRSSTIDVDLYSQALSKIERRHTQDRSDVAAMLKRGLIEPEKLREIFKTIEPGLYRYPAIDPPSFRRALEETLRV